MTGESSSTTHSSSSYNFNLPLSQFGIDDSASKNKKKVGAAVVGVLVLLVVIVVAVVATSGSDGGSLSDKEALNQASSVLNVTLETLNVSSSSSLTFTPSDTVVGPAFKGLDYLLDVLNLDSLVLDNIKEVENAGILSQFGHLVGREVRVPDSVADSLGSTFPFQLLDGVVPLHLIEATTSIFGMNVDVVVGVFLETVRSKDLEMFVSFEAPVGFNVVEQIPNLSSWLEATTATTAVRIVASTASLVTESTSIERGLNIEYCATFDSSDVMLRDLFKVTKNPIEKCWSVSGFVDPAKVDRSFLNLSPDDADSNLSLIDGLSIDKTTFGVTGISGALGAAHSVVVDAFVRSAAGDKVEASGVMQGLWDIPSGSMGLRGILSPLVNDDSLKGTVLEVLPDWEAVLSLQAIDRNLAVEAFDLAGKGIELVSGKNATVPLSISWVGDALALASSKGISGSAPVAKAVCAVLKKCDTDAVNGALEDLGLSSKFKPIISVASAATALTDLPVFSGPVLWSAGSALELGDAVLQLLDGLGISTETVKGAGLRVAGENEDELVAFARLPKARLRVSAEKISISVEELYVEYPALSTLINDEEEIPSFSNSSIRLYGRGALSGLADTPLELAVDAKVASNSLSFKARMVSTWKNMFGLRGVHFSKGLVAFDAKNFTDATLTAAGALHLGRSVGTASFFVGLDKEFGVYGRMEGFALLDLFFFAVDLSGFKLPVDVQYFEIFTDFIMSDVAVQIATKDFENDVISFVEGIAVYARYGLGTASFGVNASMPIPTEVSDVTDFTLALFLEDANIKDFVTELKLSSLVSKDLANLMSDLRPCFMGACVPLPASSIASGISDALSRINKFVVVNEVSISDMKLFPLVTGNGAAGTFVFDISLFGFNVRKEYDVDVALPKFIDNMSEFILEVSYCGCVSCSIYGCSTFRLVLLLCY